MTWEKVRTWDIGFDYGFLSNRLTGSFDYYIRYTDGMVELFHVLLIKLLPVGQGLIYSIWQRMLRLDLWSMNIRK